MADGTEQKLKFTCQHLMELDQLSKAIINFAEDIRVWLFYGEMGAGKTTLIKSICNILGVEDNVSSPTFAIVNEYYAPKFEQVYHFDFFRIEKEEEAFAVGAYEYLESGSYCFVEWPSKISSMLPERYLKIGIETEGNTRIIDVEKI